jgi:hypothetical protein
MQSARPGGIFTESVKAYMSGQDVSVAEADSKSPDAAPFDTPWAERPAQNIVARAPYWGFRGFADQRRRSSATLTAEQPARGGLRLHAAQPDTALHV